ncbi:MAG: TIGR00730 family Rossman fold protein [Bacteroidota bacterium]
MNRSEHKVQSVAVYCGSQFGNKPIYKQTAEAVALALVKRNIAVVYGGGDVGLMGVVANTALTHGGKVTGVMPKFLMEIEGHYDLTESIIVDTMHERKTIMVDRSDGFLILPGGFGTLDEFMEITTWAQLKLHHKPIGLYNVNGYYDHLIAHIDHMIAEGFILPIYRDLILDDNDLERLLDRMEAYSQQQATSAKLEDATN